jgi:hypothetical protein
MHITVIKELVQENNSIKTLIFVIPDGEYSKDAERGVL